MKYEIQKSIYNEAIGISKNLQNKLEEVNKKKEKLQAEDQPSVYYVSQLEKEGID